MFSCYNKKVNKMKTIYHPAESRGFADHGWLKAKHSFSFASYYDPERIQFGALRVLNDDIVAPDKGFATHPHNNMEIITIPLRGQLEHKDNMGNGSVISAGEVQVMSAGKGVLHSEFNPSSTEELNLFQIWIFPSVQDVKPRYDQREFNPDTYENDVTTLVSNEEEGNALFIHQKAAISVSRLKARSEIIYQNRYRGNGVYIMLVEGSVTINGNELKKRDALGVWDTESIAITAKEDAHLLFIEVPMN